MSADNLAQLTDAALSEVFAVEVGPYSSVWEATNGSGNLHGAISGRAGFETVPPFAASADAVLPYFQGIRANVWTSGICFEVDIVRVEPDGEESWITGAAPTFARAACIALIRAKRAEKGSA